MGQLILPASGLVPCKISFRLHLLVVAAQVFSCLRDGELPLDFDA
jgi:hypothetical protein